LSGAVSNDFSKPSQRNAILHPSSARIRTSKAAREKTAIADDNAKSGHE